MATDNYFAMKMEKAGRAEMALPCLFIYFVELCVFVEMNLLIWGVNSIYD